VLSVFTGIRPLVKASGTGNTAALSRDHTIHIDESGLLNITGGKWTTYRHMAEDCVNHAATLGKLPERDCVTRTLNIHGFLAQPDRSDPLAIYGSDASKIRELIERDASLAKPLVPSLPYVGAEVVWAVREEMARTLDDVLARRTRALFLNSQAAIHAAPKAATLMARELGFDAQWEASQLSEFGKISAHFVLPRPS
jgi:glycerol-3-phosphate dehydrogenase